MKNLETKWLGGVTAESYVAGCVQFTWEDSEGKPKVQKVYYQAGCLLYTSDAADDP